MSQVDTPLGDLTKIEGIPDKFYQWSWRPLVTSLVAGAVIALLTYWLLPFLSIAHLQDNLREEFRRVVAERAPPSLQSDQSAQHAWLADQLVDSQAGDKKNRDNKETIKKLLEELENDTISAHSALLLLARADGAFPQLTNFAALLHNPWRPLLTLAFAAIVAVLAHTIWALRDGFLRTRDIHHRVATVLRDPVAYMDGERLNVGFLRVLSEFFDRQDRILRGVYDNHAYRFCRVLNGPGQGLRPNTSTFFDQRKAGIGLWRDLCPEEMASSLALDLLRCCSNSVLSTVYFRDPAEFLRKLGQRNGDTIAKWLRACKKWRDVDPSREAKRVIKRVHVVVNVGSLETLLNNGSPPIDIDRGRRLYAKLFFGQATEYNVFDLAQNTNKVGFYGDYIIFDEQVMLKYDETFETIEVHYGDLVKHYAQQFTGRHQYATALVAQRLVALAKEHEDDIKDVLIVPDEDFFSPE